MKRRLEFTISLPHLFADHAMAVAVASALRDADYRTYMSYRTGAAIPLSDGEKTMLTWKSRREPREP